MRDFYFFLLRLYRFPGDLFRKVTMGKSNRIEMNAFLSKSKIGNYNYIGHGCVIDQAHIGNYNSIAAYVMIGGAEHPFEWWSTSFRIAKPSPKKTTKIEDDVWIGTKATIKQGVTVGRGAVIGSHALVLEDVPPYAIVVGIPAKILRYRFDENKKSIHSSSKFWLKHPIEAQKDLSKI